MKAQLYIQDVKLDLIKWLSNLEDFALINKILAIKNKEQKDWWNTLSDIEKDAIEKGIKDADAGNLTEHEEVRKLYGNWL